MTLRQLWVRIKALPYDAPLLVEIRALAEKAEEERGTHEVTDALSRFRR